MLIFFGAIVAALGMAAVLVLDIVFSAAPAYHFSLASVVDSISDLFSLEPAFLAVEVAKVLLLVAICTTLTYLSLRKSQSAKTVALTCIVFAAFVTFLDIRLSANALAGSDAYTLNTNVSASSFYSLGIALGTANQDSQNQDFQPAESASEVLRTPQAETGEQFESLILIVVESLGTFNDPGLDRFQLEPLVALADRAGILLDQGSVKFEGSTVPGELRELCGIRLLVVHPDMATLPTENCLPELLGNLGYTTWAIHGFIGTMFSRNRWYPALFNTVWFAPELDEQIVEAHRCGIAFHGICDTDVWSLIVELRSKEPASKKFIYWLTLSAHLPVEHPGMPGSTNCSSFVVLVQNPGLCNLVLQQRQLFTEIAGSIARGELNNTRLLLVGDHAPPFLNQDTRALFSAKDVPFIDIQIGRHSNSQGR
ncbi:MAG: hypothetical protein EXR85_03045 [Xanthomonadales bacterium]|nr:hypothetical protein [Xanthomonadales bacterium]